MAGVGGIGTPHAEHLVRPTDRGALDQRHTLRGHTRHLTHGPSLPLCDLPDFIVIIIFFITAKKEARTEKNRKQ